MPVRIDGQTYYRTAEVYRQIGVSRNTLYTWLRRGVLGETELRDRRGWRLFTQKEVDQLKTETGRIVTTNRLAGSHD
jgi:predicted site-specific integrase-resolvase